MRVATISLSLLARRLAVLAFGLWLCGAGCAFCCAPVVSIAQAQTLASTSAHVSASEDAALATAHCTAHARGAARSEAAGASGLASTSALSSSPAGERADKCCARTGQTSDAARKQYPATQRGNDNARSDFSWTDARACQVSRPTTRGRSPDARAIHVRCCVFLI